jgi:RND superfamily putative drug exporter
MREAYEHGRDAEAAVLFGIRRTARVVTGAAFIMAAVFLSFGSSTFVIPRQFGVGLTIAVLLDAFVLRLFMLPAVMRLLGDRGWWMPAVLQRHIPRLKVEG